MAHGAVKVCGKRHILEVAVAEIAIEDIPAARQAPGPTKDSNALPQTGGIFARGGGMCKVEDGCTSARALQDVCAALFSSKYIARRKSSWRSDIYEIRDRWRLACCGDRLLTACMRRGKPHNKEHSEKRASRPQ